MEKVQHAQLHTSSSLAMKTVMRWSRGTKLTLEKGLVHTLMMQVVAHSRLGYHGAEDMHIVTDCILLNSETRS